MNSVSWQVSTSLSELPTIGVMNALTKSNPNTKVIGTHTGRRSFICNALGMGISPQVVMKWTGHSDYKAMKPYIDVADEIKAEAMKKFDDF